MTIEDKFEILRIQSTELLRRASENRSRPEDLARPEDLRPDGDPSWIPGMLASGTLHDPDYGALGKLRRKHGTIIDVGANWGYSVGSIRTAGSDCPVVSFEVLPQFEACLKAVRDQLGAGYDFMMVGVGDKASTIEFVTPVVGDLQLTALTTAKWQSMKASDIKGIVSNMVSFAQTYLKDAPGLQPRLVKSTCPVLPLDEALAGYRGSVPVGRIAAIKFDVEGFEAEALAGATRTITTSWPLMLIEGPYKTPSIIRQLQRWGYLLAKFQDGGIRLVDKKPLSDHGFSRLVTWLKILHRRRIAGANGLFVHSSNVAYYRNEGILSGTSWHNAGEM